jgi:serine/threonine protein kinase
MQICAVHVASWKAIKAIAKATPAASVPDSDPEDIEKSAAIERLLLLEIDALSRLRHPNIAAFLGACFDDPSGRVLLIREFPSSAGTLAHALAAGRAAASKVCGRRAGVWAPPRRQAIRWALQLAQALNYLHQCAPRVAHGDLGPACLLLSASGLLKVRLLSE